ncbi:polysaccharide pyruvyl transferase family protein [Aerococcus urinaeequi]|uniref:polysaccharide pyruvyl transferase family protein n=1 Tax=Aerococcus urinaeequi TaxID=51665 RepID=UPI003D6B3535
MKKALLINKGHADNLGDQAIYFVLKKMLEKSGYKVDFVDFTFEEKRNDYIYLDQANKEIKKDKSKNLLRKVNRLLIKSSFIKNIFWSYAHRSSLKKIKFSNEYDLAVIGGGQLILSSSVFPSALFKWVKFIRKVFPTAKLAIFGVGVGGGFHSFEKVLEKKSLKEINNIYLRDMNSIKILKNELGFEADYTPDVVFNISEIYPLKVIKKNLILIGITDYLVYKRYNPNKLTKIEYYEKWVAYVKEYSNTNNKVELFYTSSRDLSESLKFKKYLKDNHNIEIPISEVNNLEDLIKLIAKSKVVISGRMHGLIIAYSYGSKVIPFILSDKINSFNEEYVKSSPEIKNIQNKINEVFKNII